MTETRRLAAEEAASLPTVDRGDRGDRPTLEIGVTGKQLTATATALRREIAAASRQSLVGRIVLLGVTALGLCAGVALNRCDMAAVQAEQRDLRIEIHKRSADRITSGEVHRLFEMHGRTPHAGAQPREQSP